MPQRLDPFEWMRWLVEGRGYVFGAMVAARHQM